MDLEFIKQKMQAGYEIYKNKLYSPIEMQEIRRIKLQIEHYDLLQLTKKIQLNSTYGALLNEAFRMGRRELGASTTSTGRQVTTHMSETTNRLVTGIHKPLIKTTTFDKLKGDYKNEYHMDSDGLLYVDTDSNYFQTFAENKKQAIEIADNVTSEINKTFPPFLQEKFNCQNGRELRIEANREIVGSAAIFLAAKKRYTIRVVDKEGKEVDEIKSMGSEIKKADTPKAVQNFLKGLVDLVLDFATYDELEKFVNDNRRGLIHRSEDLLSLGATKQVNNLDTYMAEYDRTERMGRGKMARCPGHVRAAINFNVLSKEYDGASKLIMSGDKIMIFYLKPNERDLKSIAFHSDLSHFPDWFTDNFQIDLSKTEEKMIDLKISGIFDAINQQVPTFQTAFVRNAFTF